MVRKHKENVGNDRGGVVTSAAEHVREDLLRCKICMYPYEPSIRVPKTLKCTHTFCDLCILQHSEQKKRSSSKAKFTCTVCKKDISLPKGGVDELPSNTTVLGLLDILNKGQSPNKSTAVFCATQTGETLERLQLEDRSSRSSRRTKSEVSAEVPQASTSQSHDMDAAARRAEKHAEATRPSSSCPTVYTHSQLYPQLRQVRFEEPPSDDQENQPPPYSTIDPGSSKAREAAASAAPPAFNSLYPDIGRGEYVETRGNIGIPLPGLTSQVTGQSQSMRVVSPGQRTLDRRLGGSLRNLSSSDDINCIREKNGATRCTPAEPLDLAIPLAGGAARQVRLNHGNTPVTASGGKAPHIVLNIAQRSGARPQQPGMAQRQVVFMNQVQSCSRPTITPSPAYLAQQPQIKVSQPSIQVRSSSANNQHCSVVPVNPAFSSKDQRPVCSYTASTTQYTPQASVFSAPSSSFTTPPSFNTPPASSYIPPTSSPPQASALAAPGCVYNDTGSTPTQSGCSVSPPATTTPKRVTMNVPDDCDPNGFSHSPLKLVKKFGSYCERTLQPGSFQLPSRISVCDNGEILVVDVNLMALQLFSTRGDQIFQLKAVGMQCACMIMGNKIAVGTHRGLDIYSRQGQALQEFQMGPVITVTAYGSGVLVVQPKSIVGYMGSDLHETSQIRKRIKGNLMRTSVPFQRLTDVAVNSNKDLVVLDAGAGEIYILSEEGHTRNTISPASLPCGRLLNPTSLAVDVHNNMYVCDTGNRRVLKFSPNGDFARSLVNFTLGATCTSPSLENTLTAYGVAVNNQSGDLLLTVTADKMAQVRIYHL